MTSVAAALAATALAQPPPGAPWETSTTTATTAPVMEALAEALAVAVHEEMSCWGALADTVGKMGLSENVGYIPNEIAI